jgi:hypothetical protein
MYGTKSVQELKDASPNAASQNIDTDVLERNSASTEIIPDEDNPLFMTVEQRAEAYRRHQENIQHEREIQENKRLVAEAQKNREVIKREQADFEALSPEQQIVYWERKQQKELEQYHAYQAKEAVRAEKLKASLSPRIEGALGEDLRLRDMFTFEEANFLEKMKVKYAHVKDALYDPIVPQDYESYSDKDLVAKLHEGDKESRKIYSVWGTFIGYAPTEAEQREQAGNGFVLGLNGTFSQLSTFVERIEHHRSMMHNAQRDLNAGADRPFLKEQIAEHQRIITDSIPERNRWLTYLKEHTDSRGVQKEIANFFADYTEFHTGNVRDLNALYREAGLV